MILEVGTPVPVQDLASAVRGDSGTFLCQNGGQVYVLEAKAGHSITFGPFPIGRKVQELPSMQSNAEPWTITKLTHQFVSNEFITNGGSRSDQSEFGRVAGRAA